MIEFTPEELDELKKIHTQYNELLTATSPLDPRMLEYNRRVRQVVFKAMRRAGHLNMALETIQEFERNKYANVPYCRAP